MLRQVAWAFADCILFAATMTAIVPVVAFPLPYAEASPAATCATSAANHSAFLASLPLLACTDFRPSLPSSQLLSLAQDSFQLCKQIWL